MTELSLSGNSKRQSEQIPMQKRRSGMSMKEDLTGKPIRLVADDTPEEDRIPEDMIEDVEPQEPKIDRVINFSCRSGVGLRDHSFAPDFRRRYPVSRDWDVPTIKCAMNDCVVNNGRGECVMPSCLSIGADGKCVSYKPMEEEKRKK